MNEKWIRIMATVTALVSVVALSVAPVAATAQTADSAHVHLVFASSNTPDPCHNGETVSSGPPEGYVHLLACTFDNADAATNTAGAPVLRWTVTGPGTLQASESETGSEGHARASVAPEALGAAEVNVELCSDPSCSSITSSDQVTIAIEHSDPPPPGCSDGVDNEGDGYTDFPDDPDCNDANDDTETVIGEPFPTTITIRYFYKTTFRGALITGRSECSHQRRVFLLRRTPEGPRAVARTFTNSRDKWKVYWPKARGRYFVVARRTEVLHSSGAKIVCTRDRSLTIRVGY